MECLICLSPTAGFHYQATCCRACAAFFRRTVMKNLRYKCGKRKSCDITYKNRFSCRYCRMKKCVALGMIVSDEPSTCFEFSVTVPKEVCQPEIEFIEDPDDLYTPHNIFGNYSKFFNILQERIDQVLNKTFKKPDIPFDLSMCQQISIAYANYQRMWPNCKKEKLTFKNIINMPLMICEFFRSLEYSAEFCILIKEFADLPIDQKGLVYKHFVDRFMQIFCIFTSIDCFGNDVDDSRVVGVTGEVFDFLDCDFESTEMENVSPEKLQEFFLGTEKVAHRLFCQPLKRLNADNFERSYLVACCMWFLEGVDALSPETIEKSERLQESLSDELYFYYKHNKKITNYASRIYRIQNIRIAEMRQQDTQMSKTFELFKVNYDC